MATRKKITRKKLKEPDEFVSTTTEIYRYVLENWRVFLSGVILVAIAVGSVFLWRAHAAKREEAAFSLYHTIRVKVDRATDKGAEICHDWDLLEKKFSGTSAAVYGRLQKASCLLKHKDYEKSRATVEALIHMTEVPPVVGVLSRLLKGYSLEEKKAYKDAEAVFTDLLGGSGNFLRDTVRYHLFLCQLRQGKKEAAKKTLAGLKIESGSDFALPVILVKIKKAQLGIKE